MKHSSDGITWTDIKEALDEIHVETELLIRAIEDKRTGEYANHYIARRAGVPYPFPYDPKKEKE